MVTNVGDNVYPSNGTEFIDNCTPEHEKTAVPNSNNFEFIGYGNVIPLIDKSSCPIFITNFIQTIAELVSIVYRYTFHFCRPFQTHDEFLFSIGVKCYHHKNKMKCRSAFNAKMKLNMNEWKVTGNFKHKHPADNFATEEEYQSRYGQLLSSIVKNQNPHTSKQPVEAVVACPPFRAIVPSSFPNSSKHKADVKKHQNAENVITNKRNSSNSESMVDIASVMDENSNDLAAKFKQSELNHVEEICASPQYTFIMKAVDENSS